MEDLQRIADRWRRVGVFAMAAGWATLAVSYWFLRGNENYLPLFWPLWFGATSVVTAWFAISPKNDLLFRAAGAMGVIGFASRPAAVYVNYAAGTVRSGWSVVVSVVVYGFATVLLWEFWLRVVRLWHIRYKAEYLAKGD
jgi:hypothetical protein